MSATRSSIAAAAMLVAACAHAQDYPTRPVTVVVPNPPGGMNQIHAQPFSAVWEKLTEAAGAGREPARARLRRLGTAYVVAQQPADGYTLLVSTANLHLVIEKDKLYGRRVAVLARPGRVPRPALRRSADPGRRILRCR